MPVSEGTKKWKNAALVWNLLGWARTGPSPPAFDVTQKRRRSMMPIMNGALTASRILMLSMPRQITYILRSQKAKKQSQPTIGAWAEGQMMRAMEAMA